MPYLTLWDKISPNFASLEAYSQKIFQISQNFEMILKDIFWQNKHKTTLSLVYYMICKAKLIL